MALVVVTVGAIVGLVVNEAMDDPGAAEPAATNIPSPSMVLDAAGPETTVSPNRLVVVDQVWLIDRGDGVFDWGVSVRTPPAAPTRSGVLIEVRLIDADDDVVEVASGVVDGIGPESTGAVTGRLTETDAVPVRLEFDVAVGSASKDRALGDLLDVRALERTADSVRGRIQSEAADPIDDITMVLLWFDDDGEVVAAVPRSVEQVRPNVDLRFDIDLSNEVAPDGRPDAVLWTR